MFRIICLFLLVTLSVSAKTEFSCMLWENQPYSEIFYKNGQEYVPLELVSDRRSKIYEIANVEFFELYVYETNPEGEQEVKLVGKSVIPPKADRVLFVLSYRPERAGLPIAVIGMNDSLDVFPAGSFRIVNFTSEELSVSVGEKSEKLEPRKLKVLKPDIPENGGLVSLVVNNQEGRPVFGRRLFGQSRSRQMVFVLVDKDAKRGVRAKLLPDILPEE